MRPLSRLADVFFILMLLLLFTAPEAIRAAESHVRIMDLTELETYFQETVLSQSPYAREDVEIQNFSARPLQFAVPLDKKVTDEILYFPQTAKTGKKVMTVRFRADGEELATVKMSGDLVVYGQVACAAQALRRGTMLSEDDIMLVRKSLDQLGNGVITDPQQLLGKQLKTSLGTGAVIFANLVKEPQIVKRGDVVSIIARNNNLQVSVPGKIQHPGAKGDVVRVKNLMSRKEVYARVLGPDAVEVEF